MHTYVYWWRSRKETNFIQPDEVDRELQQTITISKQHLEIPRIILDERRFLIFKGWTIVWDNAVEVNLLNNLPFEINRLIMYQTIYRCNYIPASLSWCTQRIRNDDPDNTWQQNHWIGNYGLSFHYRGVRGHKQSSQCNPWSHHQWDRPPSFLPTMFSPYCCQLGRSSWEGYPLGSSCHR